MLSIVDTQKKWLDIVFENLERLEVKILYGIENSSFTEESLEKLRKDLQLHYGAINNLKKSFDSDTFFTGFLEK